MGDIDNQKVSDKHSRLNDSDRGGSGKPDETNALLIEANRLRDRQQQGHKPLELAFNEPQHQQDTTAKTKPSQSDVQGNMRNAVGAYVKTDASGNVEFLHRKDNSRITPQWEIDQQGQKTRMLGFEETSAGGKASRMWTREGDKFVCSGTDGKKETLQGMEFDKTNNGNIKYVKDGQTFTVRGNGEVLPTGPNNPTYGFDEQGRITTVTPTLDDWNKGAASMAFSYADAKSEKLATVSELRKGTRVTNHQAVAGETITARGDYERSASIKLPAKDKDGNTKITELKVTRTHYAGTTDDFDKQVSEPFKNKEDKEVSKAIFDGKNNFIGVQALDRNGKVSKEYRKDASGNVTELDFANKDVTLWSRGANNIFTGKKVQENGVTVDKPVGMRGNFEFNNEATTSYIDEKGRRHVEYASGKKESLEILPDPSKTSEKNKTSELPSYVIKDENGRILKSGMITNNGPDLNNYLSYKYSDEKTADGKAIVTGVDMTYKGKTKNVWSSDIAKEAKILPDGQLEYKASDTQRVVVKPDLSISKFDKATDGGPDLLTEKSFPDGSVRTINYGEPPNRCHPQSISSKTSLPNGESITRTFNAEPVDEKSQTQYPLKAWALSEEKFSADGTKIEDGKPKSPAICLEVFDNGDFEATSNTPSNKNRYLFPARGMNTFPDGVPVPPPGPDGRLARAIQAFDSLYSESQLKKDLETLPEQSSVNGVVVIKKYAAKSPELVTELGQKHLAKLLQDELKITATEPPPPQNNLGPQKLFEIAAAMAYERELGAALLEGKKELDRLRAGKK